MSKPTLALADVPGNAVIPAAPAEKPAVPPQYRGAKSYRLLQPHYRNGVYYEAGERITVTDEVPSRTWEPIDEKPVAQKAETPKPAGKGRASDEQV